METPARMVRRRPSSPGIAERLCFFFIGLCVSGSALAQSDAPTLTWPLFRHDPQLTGRANTTGPSLPQINWVTQIGVDQLGAPVIGTDGTIFVSGEVDNNLYAIDATGRLKWQLSSVAPFIASPIVGSDGVIYLGDASGQFYAIKPDGGESWKIRLGGGVRFSANFGHDGTIYAVADDRMLYAISPEGVIKWQQDLKGIPLATPAIGLDRAIFTVAGESLAAFRPSGALLWRTSFADMGNLDGVVADRKGRIIITSQTQPLIRAVDATTGMPIWTFSFLPTWGNPSLPALTQDGGVLFTASRGGHLFSLNPDGTERWVYTDRTAELRKPPVLDDLTNIYVTNDSLGLISFTYRGEVRWQLPEVRGCYSPAFGTNRTIYIAGNKKIFAIGEQSSHIGVLEKVSGDGQRGCAGSTLTTPLAVRVRDQFNRPFPNQAIRFSVISGGGVLSDTLVESSSEGIAQVSWVLGSTSLLQQVRANGDGQSQPSVDFNATATISQVISPSSLDFGRVETGISKISKLTLTTSGDCPVLIRAVQVSGTDAQAFSPDTSAFPLTLKKQSPATINISFAPKQFGLYGATLLVFHDQQPEPLTVQLSGEGECTAPQLSVLDASVLFNETPIGDTQTMSYRISNAGCDTLVITAVHSSTSIFQPVNPGLPLLLAPGNERTLSVTFSPADTVNYLDSLRISSNDPNLAIAVLSLSGRGKLPWTVEPSAVSFGGVCISGKSTVQIEICNVSNRELRSSSMAIAGAEFQIESNSLLTVPANACRNVLIGFRPQTMGVVSSALNITWASTPLPNLVLPLMGEGIVNQLAGPDTIRFGSIPVGTSASVDSTFYNSSDCDIIITSLSTQGNNSQTFAPINVNLPITVAAGTTVSLGASFNAKHAGIAVAEFKIGTQGNTDTLRVVLFAKVTAPDIEVASRLDFPTSPFCNEVTAFLPIHNRGDDSLRISSIVTSGNNNSDFRIGEVSFPLAVPPRDSIKLQVVFDPRGSGLRKTNLIISSNDPDVSESNAIVELSGSATSGPDIETRFSTVDFDSVVVDSSLTLPLKIYNECSETLEVEAFSLNRSSFFASFAKTSIAPFDSATVNVSFTPLQTILYRDSLVIHSNDPDENPLVVKLRGVGIAPDIEIEREDASPANLSSHVKTPDQRSTAASQAELNFGRTCVKDTAKYKITIHNRGDSELRVYEMTMKSPYFKISPSTNLTIPPHSQIKVLMTFTPDSARIYLDLLTVLSNDPDENPYVVALRGDGVLPMLEVQASSMEAFKQVPLTKTADGWVKLINRGANCALSIDNVYIEELKGNELLGFTLIDRGAVRLESDSSMYVWIRFSPAAERTFDAKVIAVYNDSQDTLSYPISGSGIGLRPLLYVSATQVNFGAVPVGDSSCDTKTVYIINRGTADLSVTELKTGGPFEINSPPLPFDLAPGDSSGAIRICYKPDNAGKQESLLNVSSNAGQKDVTLSGIGDRMPGATTVCFSPGDVNFGRIALGDSSIQLVTITNCNDFTISIKSITAPGNEFRTTPDSAKLLPNESFALAVIFKPMTLGFRQGTVRLNAVSGSVVADTTFQLTGESYVKGQPKVTVSPNPFTPNGDGINEHTIFDFSSFDITHPTLKVFSLSGRLIRNLEYSGGQRRELAWDGLDDNGQLTPPGLFIFIIEEDGRKISSGHVVMVR